MSVFESVQSLQKQKFCILVINIKRLFELPISLAYIFLSLLYEISEVKSLNQ